MLAGWLVWCWASIPTLTPASLCLPTPGTHCPKGKQYKTIGQAGTPPGTGLYFTDTQGQIKTLLSADSVLLCPGECLPCPHPQRRCSLGEEAVWAVVPHRAGLWCHSPHPTPSRSREGQGLGKGGERGPEPRLRCWASEFKVGVLLFLGAGLNL